jgi:hypothetical protein
MNEIITSAYLPQLSWLCQTPGVSPLVFIHQNEEEWHLGEINGSGSILVKVRGYLRIHLLAPCPFLLRYRSTNGRREGFAPFDTSGQASIPL